MNPGTHAERRPDVATPAFPATLWTLVLRAGSAEPERAAAALHELSVRYERAIHAWFQRSRPSSVSPACAEDWAQDFMVFLHEKNPFRRLEQRDARFRAFLVTCLRNFLQDRLDQERAGKRGGGAVHLDVDELPLAAPALAAATLDRELALAIHDRVLQRIRQAWQEKDQARRYEVLGPHLLGLQPAASYAELGAILGLNANHVKKVVFDLREAYYEFFRAEVAALVSDEAALDDEMRYLAGLVAMGNAGSR
jgi:DNA-directed RNA polymerase specialized sigma24 family protein